MKTDNRGRKCSKITCKCSCGEDTVRSDLDSDPDDTEVVSGEESDLDFPNEYDDFETFDTYDPIDYDFTQNKFFEKILLNQDQIRLTFKLIGITAGYLLKN